MTVTIVEKQGTKQKIAGADQTTKAIKDEIGNCKIIETKTGRRKTTATINIKMTHATILGIRLIPIDRMTAFKVTDKTNLIIAMRESILMS